MNTSEKAKPWSLGDGCLLVPGMWPSLCRQGQRLKERLRTFGHAGGSKNVPPSGEHVPAAVKEMGRKAETLRAWGLQELRVKEGALGQEPQWPLKAGDGPQPTVGKETGTLVSQPQELNLPTTWLSRKRTYPDLPGRNATCPHVGFQQVRPCWSSDLQKWRWEMHAVAATRCVVTVTGAMENEHDFYQMFSAELAQTKTQLFLNIWQDYGLINSS